MPSPQRRRYTNPSDGLGLIVKCSFGETHIIEAHGSQH
jgi:hypothetical protein